MSLFQNSVLNKYLKGLESEKVTQAYKRFTSHFHNSSIQENIRNSKEEQYQGEFLIDLFVNVLGYTKNPTPEFNLTTELKNIKGSKKTDGAILKGEKALSVIELKGTNTTDLSKVETQAFGYKNNQPGCNYVITSNFEKLRFYIDNAVDFEEFNLFQLTRERFDILWLCLSSEYLLKDIPKKIKDESLTQEENVTKKLYKDYASFRNEIFDAIQKENPEYDKLTLFKKTQKLLDRFLFIFFAEDRLLLPPNSIRSIVNQWTDLRDKYDAYIPLYDRFKKYFGYMNTGRKGKHHDIFAYNGGLFEPDEILDNIKINDDLLYKHTLNLSNYDFESEVSVNILGHIFEHSLNDIDEIQSEIQGVASDQSKTKRKKDGVFYTPKYITKYIVDSTVGKLCEEKKTQLDIQEAEYEKERKGRRTATLKKLSQKLEDYREWLLQITICDPACGSGAFLNQALEFLIAEHQYIDELQAKLFGDAMVLSEVENAILENNIYGVDINEESVEIAKLSLWLRTAQKGRKLTSLNDNIKCGNSLIDDPIVAGDKAFNWQNEFPEVFSKGGFDVIIGNPPYVPGKSLSIDLKEYFKSKYSLIQGKYDLYILFIEKILQISNPKQVWGIIIPNTVLVNENATLIRKKLVGDKNLHAVRLFKDDVFPDASVESVVLLSKFKSLNISIYNENEIFKGKLEYQRIINDQFARLNVQLTTDDLNLLDKINNTSVKLGTVSDICIGIQIGGAGNSKDFKEKYIRNNKETENHKKFIDGKDFEPYSINWSGNYISYGDWLHRKRDEKFFLNEKIVIRQIGATPVSTIDKSQFYALNTIYCLIMNESDLTPSNLNIECLFSIINSSLIKYYWSKLFSDNKTLFPKVKKSQLVEIPITKNINQVSSDIITEAVSKNIRFTEQKLEIANGLINLVKAKYKFSPSKKLQNWHELEFGEFIKELEKARKKSAKENKTVFTKLTISDEAEWMKYYNEQKQKAEVLKAEIEKTDKQIDQMVYELYGLTEEEINIVQDATA